MFQILSPKSDLLMKQNGNIVRLGIGKTCHDDHHLFLFYFLSIPQVSDWEYISLMSYSLTESFFFFFPFPFTQQIILSPQKNIKLGYNKALKTYTSKQYVEFLKVQVKLLLYQSPQFFIIKTEKLYDYLFPQTVT